MIPPTMLPNSALSLLTKDLSGETGDLLQGESPFSALLEASIGLGPKAKIIIDGAAVPASTPDLATIAPAPGKPSGKPSGKTLPDIAHLAGQAAQAKGEELVPLSEAAPEGVAVLPGEPAPPGEEQPAEQVTSPQFNAAFLTPVVSVLPESLPLPGQPTATEVPRQPQAKTATAPPAPFPLGPVPVFAAAQGAPEAEVGQVPQAGLTALTTAIAAELPRLPHAKTANAPLAPFPPGPVPVLAAAQVAPRAAPRPDRVDSANVTVPASMPVISVRAAGVAVRDAGVAVRDAGVAVPSVIARVAAESARVQPVAAAIRQRANIEPSPLPEAGAVAARKPAVGQTRELSGPAPSPALPSVIAGPDAAALAAPLQYVTQAQAAPAPSSPSVQHDFAALIDRLVEARQTAQSSLAAQTVTAAINHAEFGQVSLQFRHDGEGLSVAMAANDPELARAVQIAAPGAATGAQTGGNPEGAPPRQDGSGQQTATASQSQTQQQRGGSPQRFADDARAAANPTPRQRSQGDPDQRGGIFA
jgi:hypothetical protein